MTSATLGRWGGAAALPGGVAAPDPERTAAASSFPARRERNRGRGRHGVGGLARADRTFGRRPIEAWSWSHTQASDLWDGSRGRAQPPWRRLVALLLALAAAALLAQVGL